MKNTELEVFELSKKHELNVNSLIDKEYPAIPLPLIDVAEIDQEMEDVNIDKFVDDEDIPYLPSSHDDEDVKLDLLANPVTNSDLTKFPYSCCGKLYMQFPNGSIYVGSAFAVSPTYVMTAAHCVYNEKLGGFAAGVTFIPSYPQNNQGYSMSIGYKLKEYTGGQYAYDLAVFKITGSTKMKSYLGVKLRQKSRRSFKSIGYPAAGKYAVWGGNQMFKTIGRKSKGTTYLRGTIGMRNNDMTGGCSGGPWLIRRTKNKAYKSVNGINSYKLSSKPNRVASPYFGTQFIPLLSQVLKG
ncbi:MAG: trypsin-like serine peptidase [Fluviicola sp.]